MPRDPFDYAEPSAQIALPAKGAPAPVTTGEVYRAAQTLQDVDNSDWESRFFDKEFAPILEAVNDQRRREGLTAIMPPSFGYMPGGSLAAFGRTGNAYAATASLKKGSKRDVGLAILAEAARIRQSNPAFLPGVGTDIDAYLKPGLDRIRADRAQAGSVMARSSGVVQGAVGFAGGMTEAMKDPVNIATLPIGGGAVSASRSLLVQAVSRMALEGAINAGVETLLMPVAAQNREAIGEELTVSEGVRNVLFAFAGGAAFSGAIMGGVHAGSKLVERLTPLDHKLARALEAADPAPASQLEAFAEVVAREDPELLGDLLRAGNGGDLAPEAESALAVLRRDREQDKLNPFVPIGAGRAQFDDELTRTIDQVLAGAERPTVDPREIAMPARAVTEGGAEVAAPAPGRGYDREAVKAKIRGPESGGRDNAVNGKGSSASGRYQFVKGTFKEYYRKVFGGDNAAAERAWRTQRFDPEVQERLMDRFTDDNAAAIQRAGFEATAGNVYLAHFAGRGRAVKLLQAPPDAPVSRYFTPEEIAQNPTYLGGGKSVSEAIAAVHHAIGGRSASVPSHGGKVSGGEESAILREEALQLNREAAEIEGLGPVQYDRFDPDEIQVDAELMQFKSGGDQFGVTERLQGVSQWNPLLAGRVVIWEALDGRKLIADGHQRRGLASRIKAADPAQQPMLDALVLREADGWNAETVRTWAALKNIAEGSGSSVDAAKVMRGIPREDWAKYLPPKSALVRDAEGLVRLGDDAFGMVVNELVDASHAAIVGRLAQDPGEQKALVDLLAKLAPRTIGEADGIVRQGMMAGFANARQEDMFGSLDVATSLFVERARVLDRGLAELRKMRQAFGSAARHADTLEAKGNRIDRKASEKEVEDNAKAVELVRRSAWSAGPVKDAIDAGAARLAAGERIGDVVRDFVGSVRQLELDDLARLAGSAESARGGGGADGSGRFGETDAALEGLRAGDADPAEPQLTPQGDRLDPEDNAWPSREELEAAGQGGFDLGADMGPRFDEPTAEGPRSQLESLEHDYRMAVAQDAAGKVEKAKRLKEVVDNAPPEVVAEVDAMLGRAEQHQAALVQLGKRFWPGAKFSNPGLKSRGRIIEKVLSEGYASAAELKDVVRAGFEIREPEAADMIAKDLLARYPGSIDKGWRQLEPSHYLDRKIILALGDGMQAEIQLVPAEIWKVKKGEGGWLYDQARSSKDAARQAAANDRARALYDAALAGSDFEGIAARSASGKVEANASPESRSPSNSDLATSAGASRQLPPDQAQAEADLRSTATGRSSTSNSSSVNEVAPQPGNAADDSAFRADLQGNAAQVDPAVAARQAQELALRAEAPMRGQNATGQAQDGTMGLGLFDAFDQPQFALERESLFTVDGADRSLGEILDSAEADRAAIAAARACLA